MSTETLDGFDLPLFTFQPKSLFKGASGSPDPDGIYVQSLGDFKRMLEEFGVHVTALDEKGSSECAWRGLPIFVDSRIKRGGFRYRYPSVGNSE